MGKYLKESVGYRALHYRIEGRLGKPTYCQKCDSPRGRFEWANISGQYLDRDDDWLRLCRRCHMEFDKRRSSLIFKEACRNGHRLTLDKLYLRRGTGWIECRDCRKNQVNKFWNNKKGVLA